MTEPGIRPARLHGAPVWVGEVRVGSVKGLIGDESGLLVGLEVAAIDGRRWFLPKVACEFDGQGVHASSPLVFLGATELDYYVRRGIRIGSDDLDVGAFRSPPEVGAGTGR